MNKFHIIICLEIIFCSVLIVLMMHKQDPIINVEQTVFIDQVRHDSISYSSAEDTPSTENNFVVTTPFNCESACSGAIMSMDIAKMKCDDLARWWNSHNNNNNDEIWTEITKLGCR